MAAYRVETERLLLRCWSPADAPLVRTAIDASDEHLRRWIPFMQDEPRSLEATADRIRTLRSNFDTDAEYRYAMLDRDEATLHGGVGLYRRVGPEALESGYWLREASVGKGYATEAAAAVVRIAFEILGVERVEMHCGVPNMESSRVPERLGFVNEGTLARRGTDGFGNQYDLMIWTMFADRYPDSVAASAKIAAFDCLGRQLI